MDLTEDFWQENVPDPLPFLISLGVMLRLHRAQPIRSQGPPREGNKEYKKGNLNPGRSTPVGVGPLSCLKSMLLTACSVNPACLCCPGLSFQFFATMRWEPREKNWPNSGNGVVCEEDGNKLSKGNHKGGETTHYQNPKYFQGRVDSKAGVAEVSIQFPFIRWCGFWVRLS